MTYQQVRVNWNDGKTAVIKAPDGGWLEYLIRNYRHGDYRWGYVVKDAHPFHMTNVYPDEIMKLAKNEYDSLKKKLKVLKAMVEGGGK